MQGIGAALHSSLELVQTAIHSQANSSMARLEDNSSDGRTHSRSGSGLDAALSSNGSSNENHMFGHPLRTQWRPSQEEEQEVEPEAEGLEEGGERTGSTQVDEVRHHACEFVSFGTVTGAVGEDGIAFAWPTARGSARACWGADNGEWWSGWGW